MTYTIEEMKEVFGLKRTRMRGDNLMSSCPFKDNHTDSYPSFGLNLETGQYNCFSCSERGDNVRTLAYKLNILLPDNIMKKSLRKIKGIKKDKKIEFLDKDFKFPEGTSSDAVKELSKRGISSQVIKDFKVVKTGDGSIIFPCTWGNKYTGYIQRNSKWDGRYGYFPEGVKRSFLLFGVEQEENNELFLVESMTDCLKLKTFGVNAVSTCGNMIFSEQAKRLVDIARKIVLVPQRDLPARRWIIDAEDKMKGQIPIYGITIDKEFKDVGQADYKLSHWKEDIKTKKFLF
jgi:DNA primase